MRYVRLLLLLAIFTITSLTTVFAITPPFPGGPILSPYGAKDAIRNYEFHGGIDFDYEGPIVAPSNGTVIFQYQPAGEGNGGGYMVFFTFSDGPYQGQTIGFVDLGIETTTVWSSHNWDLNAMQSVTEGTVIAIVSGNYGAANSSGAHLHFQHNPQGLGAGYTDPTPILNYLGVKVTDGPISVGGNSEKPGVSWNVEALMTMGNSISDTIKEWTGYATKALKNLHTVAIDLLISLAIIDFAMMVSLSGFHVTPFDVIPKLLKYSFFIMLINYWDKFLNWFFRGFVEASSNIYGGSSATFTTDVSQPQLLLQKAIHLIEPALQKLAAFGARDFVSNFASAMSIYILCAVVTAIFIVVALYIMVCYIEFYVSAGLNIINLPFGVLHWTKFVPEGSLGHLVSSTLKLVIITCLVGLTTIAIKDATVADMFSAKVDKTVESLGIPTDPTGNGYVAMIYEEAAKAGVDGDIILAIAMRESGGDTIDAIQMTQNYQGSSAQGIMQVMDDQDIQGPDGNRVAIADLYPNYKTDPRQNIAAGVALFKDKLRENGGNLQQTLHSYGDGTDEYIAKVNANYINVKTHNYGALYGKNNPHQISTEQLGKFLVFCLILIGFAFLILKLPNRIMKPLQGSVELP